MVICYSCKGELIHWCLPGVSVEGKQVVTRTVLAPPSKAHSQGQAEKGLDSTASARRTT